MIDLARVIYWVSATFLTYAIVVALIIYTFRESFILALIAALFLSGGLLSLLRYPFRRVEKHFLSWVGKRFIKGTNDP